jgi:acyl-coenzyme A thioesterase PaaI-like protein
MLHTHKLPNSRHCFACGMENDIGLKLQFYADGLGGVVGEYTISKEFESYPDIAHGGIVATMLDEALIRAFLLEDPNRFMYTAKLSTRLRKHVPINQALKLTAKITRDRGSSGEAEAKIFSSSGDLLAEGDALMVAVTDDDLSDANLEELGWRVYPDEELAA